MVKMHVRGNKHFGTVGPILRQAGWYGGTWVRYIGKRTFELATPTSFCGFLLLGYKLQDLDAKPYDYVDSAFGGTVTPFEYENNAIQAYGQTLMITDSGEFDFNKFVYDTTQNYTYNQKLYINNNGFITNVNGGGGSVGIVSATPQDNNLWLGITLNVSLA